MDILDKLTTSSPPKQTEDRVHDNNFVLNQLRNAVVSKNETPINLNDAVRTEEVTIQFENNSQVNTSLRNVEVGAGSVTFENGSFTISTDATADSHQALETANLGEYTAGLEAGIGLLIQKDTDPSGFAEWGYGGDGFSNELRWHLSSDGSYRFERVRDGVITTIPQSLWDTDTNQTVIHDENGNETGVVSGLDPLDGTGDSGTDIATPTLGLFGVDFVLYGGGGFAPWFVDLTTERKIKKIYPFVFHPTNEDIITQFNQPIFARIDNDGTAESDSLIVTERQFTKYGTSTAPSRGTPHIFDLEKTVDSPTALLALRRESKDTPTKLTFSELQFVIDNPVHTYFLVDPEITANNEDANWLRPRRDFNDNRVRNTETQIEVNEALTVDASTGISVESEIASASGSKNNVEADDETFDNSIFIRDKPLVLMAEPFADANNSTSQEGVINIEEQI